MVSTTVTRAPARTGRVAALLAAGVVVAGIATTVIALTARMVGAGDAFPPLQPYVYLPFVVLGFAAATAGWAIVRVRAARPASVLRILVPVLTVLSFVPDVALGVLAFIPGTTTTGAIALGLMHLAVVGVAVPVLARALPVGERPSR
jgi:hypothetical protein